jgi:hypothetical protein
MQSVQAAPPDLLMSSSSSSGVDSMDGYGFIVNMMMIFSCGHLWNGAAL